MNAASICILLFCSFNSEITTIRNTYKKAVDESSKANELVQITSNYGSNALLMAYYGTGKALQAKHGWNPMNRFSLATEASNLLNNAVSRASFNLEIRFLRFSFECRAPSVLGITYHTVEDKRWIMAHIDKKHPIWDVMKAFLKQCDLLSETEKQGL